MDALVTEFSTLRDVARDKGLAKIGDGFINLAFSVALSACEGRRTGRKVSKDVLARALKYAHLREYARPRADAHERADAVEAILAYGFLKGLVPLAAAIEVLARELAAAREDVTLTPVEQDARAVGQLLEVVKARLPIVFFDA